MIRSKASYLLVPLLLLASLRAQEVDPAQARKDALKAARALTPRFDPGKFVAWMKQRGADTKVIEVFRSEWDAGADARITDRVLRKLLPQYAKAMKLVSSGDPKGVLELAKVLSSAEDPYIRAHSRFFLAKAVLDEDDPEGASELLKEFVRNDRGHSLLDPEAAFYLGYSLSLIPSVGEAILNLDAFLKLYPDAPERYRANAADLLVELQSQWDSPLHQIADDMKWSERKLKKEKTGKPVQTRQLEIVEQLSKLIEELEKSGGGGGPPSGNRPPNGPAGFSKLPEGQGRVGSLHGSRGVKDRWGDMKDRDRDKILNEVQAKLPDHLRVLIEKYYKKVNR